MPGRAVFKSRLEKSLFVLFYALVQLGLLFISTLRSPKMTSSSLPMILRRAPVEHRSAQVGLVYSTVSV